MGTLGIIPAAGDGSRWGGRVKCLLPIDDRATLLDHTIRAMLLGGADDLLIICNENNIGPIARGVNVARDVVRFGLQTMALDMWGAMLAGLYHEADRYLMAMPDTYYPQMAFTARPLDVDFALGTFTTDYGERFGTIRGGRVLNKVGGGKRFTAWGLLTWTAAARDLWAEAQVNNYTDAINAAITAFGLHTWAIDYYHDMAAWEDYEAFIRRARR